MSKLNSINNINKDEFQVKQITPDEVSLFNKLSTIANVFVNTNNLDKNDFFSRVFETAFSLIPEAQKGSYFERAGKTYRPIFCKGYDFDLLSQLTFSQEEAFVDYQCGSFQMIEAYQINVAQRDDTRFSERQIELIKKLGTYSDYVVLYAPIMFDEQIIGILSIENFDDMVFSEASRLILKIYAQLISNFYSFKAHQERENNRNKEIINALVSAIEVKDLYTVGHAKRVSDISLKLAKILGISSARFRIIETAAILHDVGKIGTPTEILNKKSSLTSEEYEIIKRHPADAKKILGEIEGFEEILDLTLMHHEHYDGSGYPNGLSGERIPIEAQIIQAADAFDAMTSKRAYREAMCIDTAMEIFRRQRGKQFHPGVTDAILSLFSISSL